MISGQNKLLYKAQDSIRGAKGLVEMDLPDIAITRAYYAMFYIVQAILLTQALSFSKHAAVISAFGKHFAKSGIFPAKYHQYLREAKEERLLGDYDIERHFTREEALVQIERAQEFLAFTEQWLKARP